MSADPTCVTCGKKVRAGRSGSLTQWLFTEDSCECGGKVSSLKLSEEEKFLGADASRMCAVCGKLRSDSRQGSLTQWVFGAERCRCDYDKLKPGDLFDGLDQSEDSETLEFSSELDPDLIDELELGEINYHGFSPDSFPFDRYRIISEKGRGNNGLVYEAWDCSLRKRVAIKTMFSYQWSSDELVRFQSEARSASRLNHPNVLQILDFGASPSGQPYMVMEYVDGSTLKELVDEAGGIETSEALPLFLQVCQGLAHAHREGIFHRDVKCSNIMIGKNRNDQNILKVIDFGIAALVHGHHAGLTLSGNQAVTIVGSPFYMSPDQLHGLKFDARSEVYSVGCVMFETLCGAVPFDGDSVMSTMNLHASEPVPELLNLHGELVDCPASLYGAIKKCLEKDPDDRFQDFDELHDCLVDIQEKLALELIESKISKEALEQAAEEKRNRANSAGRSAAIALAIVSTASIIGISAYKMISAVPTPVVVPTSTTVEIYDKEETVDAVAKLPSEMFDDLKSDSLSVRYMASPRRLVIDGTQNADKIIERAIKSKLVVKDLEIYNVTLSPDEFQRLSLVNGLEDISITDVVLPKDFSWLAKIAKLKKLKFTGIDADVPFFKTIATLSKLRLLDIDESAIQAEGLACLRTFPLDRLSVKSSKLTSEHVKVIAQMKTLRSLFLGDTGISDSDVRQLANLGDMVDLGISGLPVTDDTLLYLGKKMPALSALCCFRCHKLSHSAIRKLCAKMPNLSVMDDQSGDIQKSFTPVD
jgi:serine/threonine protein kinase